MTGGEPLCKFAALPVTSRRLPGITQRDPFIWQLLESKAPTCGPKKVADAGQFPGAACSPPVLATLGIRQNTLDS